MSSQVIGLIEIDTLAQGREGWDVASDLEEAAFARNLDGTKQSRIAGIQCETMSLVEADRQQLMLDLQAELELVLRRIRANK